MAYVTTSQLSQRLGATLYARLTDRVAGASADAAVAQQIVDEAQSEADALLAHRYQTPLDLEQHPEIATTLVARVLDLAEYVAWKGSPFVSEIPARVQRLYAGATAWLESVARGAAELPAASPPAGRVAVDDAPRLSAPDRRFTADELEGF